MLYQIRIFASVLGFGLCLACGQSGSEVEQSSTPEKTEETQMPVASPAVPSFTKQAIRESYKDHGALTQYHRWFLVYENDAVPVENSLDLLTEDISLKSALGEASGHAGYTTGMKQLPTSWDNAHFVLSKELVHNEDGSTNLTATIDYLNKGMLNNDAIRMVNVHYDATLVPTDTVLPKFSRLEIAQKGEDTTADIFVDAYPENRLRSLVHYWLALIEDPDRDAAPFEELLAEGYALNFSSGVIDDFDKFTAWYNGPASSFEATKHVPYDFGYEIVGDNTYQMEVKFDWNGLLPNGDEMIAKTQHRWLVEDNPADRFPKIKTIDVDVLVPFGPKL